MQVRIPWLRDDSSVDVYFALCKLWASPEFRLVSEKARLCRGTEPKHTYGADGHVRLAKRIVSWINS